MGLVKFNADSPANGETLIYRPKALPVTNQVNGFASGSIPVLRSGVTDKAFDTMGQNAAGILLKTTSSSGAVTTTATISFNTHLTSSKGVAYHLNTADQCLYVLLYTSPNYQLIKIADTTGVVTAIGSSFTPVTAANWPTYGTSTLCTIFLDSVSGHIKVVSNGKYHLINKSTGAIVSQDTALTVGASSTHHVFYQTLDGVVGVSNLVPAISGAYNETLIIPNLVHVTYGWSSGFIYSASLGGRFFHRRSPLSPSIIIMVDEDKILLQDLVNSDSASEGVFVTLRTEFDKYIVSLAEYANGK